MAYCDVARSIWAALREGHAAAAAHHGGPPGGRGLRGVAPQHQLHRHGVRGPHSRAVQVDPIKPKLKPPGTKRLKLECDGPLSNFAFKFKLLPQVRLWDVQTGDCVRIFTGHRGGVRSLAMCPDGKSMASGRGLHSSTFSPQLQPFLTQNAP